MRIDPRAEQAAVRAVLWTLTGVTVVILVFIIAYVLRKGIPVLNAEFLTRNPVDMGAYLTGFTAEFAPLDIDY